MARKVRLISRGMDALLEDPGVTRDLRRRAERVLQVARANAPVATGAYRDSLAIEEDETDRTVVRVVSHDRKAMAVEARTGNLARSLDAAGGSR